jgi:hypothetical protein
MYDHYNGIKFFQNMSQLDIYIINKLLSGVSEFNYKTIGKRLF